MITLIAYTGTFWAGGIFCFLVKKHFGRIASYTILGALLPTGAVALMLARNGNFNGQSFKVIFIALIAPIAVLGFSSVVISK